MKCYDGACDQCGRVRKVRMMLIERENCVYDLCAPCGRLAGAIVWIDPLDQ